MSVSSTVRRLCSGACASASLNHAGVSMRASSNSTEQHCTRSPGDQRVSVGHTATAVTSYASSIAPIMATWSALDAHTSPATSIPEISHSCRDQTSRRRLQEPSCLVVKSLGHDYRLVSLSHLLSGAEDRRFGFSSPRLRCYLR